LQALKNISQAPVVAVAKLEIQIVSKKNNFITPKLVEVLDMCQVSSRNAVYILEATFV